MFAFVIAEFSRSDFVTPVEPPLNWTLMTRTEFGPFGSPPAIEAAHVASNSPQIIRSVFIEYGICFTRRHHRIPFGGATNDGLTSSSQKRPPPSITRMS